MARKEVKTVLAMLAGAAVTAGVWAWTGAAPALGPPSRSDDCVDISIWSTGFHTDLLLPASALPGDHPLRRLDPTAKYFAIGWGDEAFFRSDGRDLLLGAQALLPGGPTTMNVIAADRPLTLYNVPKDIVPLALSREGVARIAERLSESLVLDEHNNVQIIAPGHGAPRAWFLKSRGEFNLFNLCNHWIGRNLRAGGVDINAAFLYSGDLVVAATRSHARSCPKPLAPS